MSIRNKIVSFVKSYTEYNGYPPTRREITEAVGLKSVSTTVFHLEKLKAQGYLIIKDNTARAIAIGRPMEDQ